MSVYTIISLSLNPIQWAKQNLTSHSQKPVITHIVFNLISKFDRKSQNITYCSKSSCFQLEIRLSLGSF